MISKIPYLRYSSIYRRNCKHRPGHFYSPVVDVKDLAIRENQVWRGKALWGIDLNLKEQFEFTNSLREAAAIIPFPERRHAFYRYYYNNNAYNAADALVLFSMLLKYKPKKVIEVGSGFSSALMLDTNARYLKSAVDFMFIEPNPKINLDKVLWPKDYKNATIRNQPVQNISPDVFGKLQAGDILFIDSSHVSKTGSDVNYLITDVLPYLNSGVIVHFHDIFYPFEYPKEWVLERRYNWNEIYMVHSFLLFNSSFEILFFSDYMHGLLKEQLDYSLPLFTKYRSGSLWLRKK